MKKPIVSSNCSGYALLMVMVTTAVGLTVTSAYLKWSSTKESMNERSKVFRSKLQVAEASTETFYSHISKDFLTVGKERVDQRIWQYSSWYTTSFGRLNVLIDNDPADQAFSQELLFNNWTFGTKVEDWALKPLLSSLEGLYGEAATFKVYSYGRKTGMSSVLVKNIEQNIQCASLPLFQFGIFYIKDLELSPGADIDERQTLHGRVHSNASMYLRPSGKLLQFQDPVTSSGEIFHTFHPDDPRTTTPTDGISYNGDKLSQVKSFVLPVGETPPQNAGHILINKPPLTESKDSILGKFRMYNKADLIIEVYDSDIIRGFSGAYNNFNTQIPQNVMEDFVDLSLFFNRREYKYVRSVDIDMEEFLDSYDSLKSALGREIRVLYIADLRTDSFFYQSGVRLIEGEVLPETGLTVATMNPLYVQGDYNIGETRGRGNRGRVISPVVPASLMADAITVLSANWKDSDSTKGLGSRRASKTTVNAALIGGIVPSGGGFYSGGMENLVRLLEDWSGRVLDINGSYVVLFESEIATAPWGTYDVYNTPRRRYSFDDNFLNPNLLPPGTPEVRMVIRNPWIES